jgi:hypothetical protein
MLKIDGLVPDVNSIKQSIVNKKIKKFNFFLDKNQRVCYIIYITLKEANLD